MLALTVAILVSILLPLWPCGARAQGNCTPTAEHPIDPRAGMYALKITQRGAANAGGQGDDPRSLRSRLNDLRQMTKDHSTALANIRDCFRECTGYDGSISGNIGNRRCQQRCKSYAIEQLQTFWAMWPEARDGVGRVTVSDDGEMTIEDSGGNETSEAQSNFYLANKYREMRMVEARLSQLRDQSEVPKDVEMWVTGVSNHPKIQGLAFCSLFNFDLPPNFILTTPQECELAVIENGRYIVQVRGQLYPSKDKSSTPFFSSLIPKEELNILFLSLRNGNELHLRTGSIVQSKVIFNISYTALLMIMCVRSNWSF
jgi:hypothetical protein